MTVSRVRGIACDDSLARGGSIQAVFDPAAAEARVRAWWVQATPNTTVLMERATTRHGLPPGARRVHFVGVGGIGMSGIAEMMSSLGYEVSGSDLTASAVTVRLCELGIGVEIGHDARSVGDAEAIVVSAAVPDDNPEVIEARRRHLPDHPTWHDAGRTRAVEVNHRRDRLPWEEYDGVDGGCAAGRLRVGSFGGHRRTGGRVRQQYPDWAGAVLRRRGG